MSFKLILFTFLFGGLILLNDRVSVNALPALPLQARQDPNGPSLGKFDIVGNSGVNAMHAVLVGPKQVVFIDKLEANALKRVDGKPAISSMYDLTTNQVKALGVYTNTFCSAGSWLSNGTLVEVGGDTGDANYRIGRQTIRLFDPTVGDWVELENVLPSNRWYPAMTSLPNGRVLILGGAKAGTGANRADVNNPTYTIYPPQNGGAMTDVPFEFLTTTLPFNLYPMVHVIPNFEGKTLLFVGANQAAIQYDLDTASTIYTYPKIPDAIRSYPLTASSVMLPLSPTDNYNPTIMVCGGNTVQRANSPAASSCGRLEITKQNGAWEMDNFGGQGRVMPDATFLVDGSVLFINGAGIGFAGFHQGSNDNPLYVNDNPVLTPQLYDPNAKTYKALNPSTIPRLYHSISTLIPDGTVLIAGSNPQANVALNSKYPTEYRVEVFSPPYLSSSAPRPNIISIGGTQIGNTRIPVTYGQQITMIVQCKSNGTPPNLKASIIHHGFITHSQNFSQRYVYLEIVSFMADATTADQYIVTIKLPPNPTIINPGPSYIYVFNLDSPPVTGAPVLLQSST